MTRGTTPTPQGGARAVAWYLDYLRWRRTQARRHGEAQARVTAWRRRAWAIAYSRASVDLLDALDRMLALWVYQRPPIVELAGGKRDRIGRGPHWVELWLGDHLTWDRHQWDDLRQTIARRRADLRHHALLDIRLAYLTPWDGLGEHLPDGCPPPDPRALARLIGRAGLRQDQRITPAT